MLYRRITAITDPLFSKCREIYCRNFPIEEQRSLQEQERIFKEYSNFYFYALIDANFKEDIHNPGNVMGIFSFWKFKSCYFGEHLAIDDKYKGCGIGSLVIAFLKKQGEEENIPVILEIEMPDHPAAIRREAFYKRLGFVTNSHTHFQPPFHKGQTPLEMKIMSYPHAIDSKAYEAFKKEEIQIMPTF